MARLNKRKKPIKVKTVKKGLFSNALLLKQTLISTWKSKLQLVILLLLSAFATSLITGSWISYNRMIDGSNELGLNNLNFDAVLPYPPVSQGIWQIADQAFSLKLGKLYDSDPTSTPMKSIKALYFDNTKIGTSQEIIGITKDDLKIDYVRDTTTHKITGFNSFYWTNTNNPLTFNLNNDNVKASIYGQLLQKASATTNLDLKNHFIRAADDLYRDIFLKKTAPDILISLADFTKAWIIANPTNNELSKSNDEFTAWILANKINYQGIGSDDKSIPDSTNLQDQTQRTDLFSKIVKTTDSDPRVTTTYGMNGQWMRIYRKFDSNETNKNIFTNFKSSYNSPSNYNQISDSSELDAYSSYSYFLARATAALQSHDLYVRNQFNASAGIIDDKLINVKVVDIGLPNAINHTNLKVFEGVAPTSRNEIVITPQYARKNISNKPYRPGDHISINDNDFIVSGIGGDAYDIYPTLNALDPIPNTRTEFIAYVTPSAWNNGNWIESKNKTDNTLMYFTPWDNTTASFNTTLFDDYFQKTIFSNNGNSELNQDDYNKYLIEKYVKHTKDPKTTYTITPNPTITSDNSQFSIYSGRKKIFNSSVAGFEYASITGVLFLVSIVIFITTLIVKKAIQHGQVSMGILKSIGYKTWQITTSYLAYPLIALLVSIPIGWIVGLVVQVYLTEIFNTLFVLPYNVFNFDVIPLFISIGLIIGFIGIATLLTAFRILKKDPLLLIKKDSDLTLGTNSSGKASGFLKNHFRLRFLLSLSKTSWKKILVTSGVITLATLSIVATTAIPTTINSLKTNYFKSQKYKNYYEYQTPMPNMPMSKYGLYSWNYFNKPKDEPYYPVYGAMPWPEDKIIYDKNQNMRVGWYNPLAFKKTSVNNNFNDIFTFDKDFIGDKNAFLNKMSSYYGNSTTAPNGTLDINDLIWSYSWLGGKAFSNDLLTGLNNQDTTARRKFSSNLIDFASTQLPNILEVPNPGVPAGKDAIKEILKQVLPGFVRQSLDSLPKNGKQDPYDYFAIGHNTVAFNPNHNSEINGSDEELVTQFKIATNDPTIAKDVSMDAIGIDPNTAMLVLKNDEAKKLNYSDTATEIPMIINRAFQSKFDLKEGSSFDGFPNINTLYYVDNNNKNIPLPKENWYYGANPPATPPINPNDNGGIWSKNGTKWNYRGNVNINLPTEPTTYSDTQGYEYNGMYDSNGKPILNKDNPNSWNDVNNIWLKLPTDINVQAKSGDIHIHTADGKKKLPFNLDRIKDNTGEWIRPFSYNLIDPKIIGFNPNLPLSVLLNRPPEWFMGMVDKGLLKKQSTLSDHNLQQDIKNMPSWWKNITGDPNPVHKYRIVGIQDSYDSPKAYIDQKWANKIIGYNAYNDNPYCDGTTIPQWFSGKLSTSDNIFDIIGRMSFKSNLDDYTIYATTDLNGNRNYSSMIASYDLLSRKQAMLNKMSDIAFSASALFIVTTIICSILIVIMITDLFTDQFCRFMAHMKAEGYTNWEINSFTLGIFTPWVLVGYIVGFALGFLMVFALINILAGSTLVLPFTITWWILPASFIVIAGIYISTFIINNDALNKMNLIELLKSDE